MTLKNVCGSACVPSWTLLPGVDTVFVPLCHLPDGATQALLGKYCADEGMEMRSVFST